MAKKQKEQAMYVVLTADGNVVWDDKTERAKVFTTKAAALKEARNYATSEPGETVSVYRKAADVRLPIATACEVETFD